MPTCGPRDVDYMLASHYSRSMHISGYILISPSVHLLTHDQVLDEGFTGIRTPVDQPFGFLCLGTTHVMLAHTSQWDGGAEGRIQKVVANTPRRHWDKARDFLQRLDPVQAVMGEVVVPEQWATTQTESSSTLVTEPPPPVHCFNQCAP